MDLYPPLREWSVENFKSAKKGHVDLRYLTVIVGANSSGKSSFLQSILVVAQAAQAGSTGPTFPLNGHLISLGGFHNVVSTSAKRKEVKLRGVFGLPQTGRRRWYGQRQPSLDPDAMTLAEWELRLKGSAANDPGAANISRIELKQRLRESGRWDLRIAARATRAQLLGDGPRRESIGVHSGSAVVRGRSQRIEQAALRSGLPTSFPVPRPEVEVLVEQWLLALQDRSIGRPETPTVEPEGLSQSAIDLAVTDISERRASRPDASIEETRVAFTQLLRRRGRGYTALVRAVSGNEEEIRARVLAELGSGDDVLVSPNLGVQASVADAVDPLEEFLTERVSYLGPLRQDPQPSYSLTSGTTARTIGVKGEIWPPSYTRCPTSPSRARFQGVVRTRCPCCRPLCTGSLRSTLRPGLRCDLSGGLRSISSCAIASRTKRLT